MNFDIPTTLFINSLKKYNYNFVRKQTIPKKFELLLHIVIIYLINLYG